MTRRQTNRGGVQTKQCPRCGAPSDATPSARRRYQHECRAYRRARRTSSYPCERAAAKARRTVRARDLESYRADLAALNLTLLRVHLFRRDRCLETT
jgi:hypothetical protein